MGEREALKWKASYIRGGPDEGEGREWEVDMIKIHYIHL